MVCVMLALGALCTISSVIQLASGGRDAQGRHGQHEHDAAELRPGRPGPRGGRRGDEGPVLADDGGELEEPDGEVRGDVGGRRDGDRLDVVDGGAQGAPPIPRRPSRC